METATGMQATDDGVLGGWASEQLMLCRDDASGLRAAIAIDDTTRGPAFGGVRLRSYPSYAAGVEEAQRLATAMTRKHAAADLPYGGGKSVIFDDGRIEDREALMRAFGRFVARLHGGYLPGVDMGTTTEDMALMAQVGAEVSCAADDPSPSTAIGVGAAIRAAIAHVDGRPGVDGVRVLVQGAGHVGATLARDLARDGAQLLIADVDGRRAAALAADVGGDVVAPDAVTSTACDVFAPCAIARVVSGDTVDRLDCRIISGAANDTLADDGLAERLAQRGIAYVPDFVANAGGVIQVHGIREGWDERRTRSEIERIGERVGRLLADADERGESPLRTVDRLVAGRVGRARGATAPTSSVAGPAES